MINCNNAYLKTGFELSVLQLLKAATEEIRSLQLLQEAFKLKRFEQKLAPNQSLLYHDEGYFKEKKDYIDKQLLERITGLESQVDHLQSIIREVVAQLNQVKQQLEQRNQEAQK